MNLQNIQAFNYRNYDQVDLSFPSMINLFVGQNAQGKTNLLEAISVLALAKSHRSGKDQELIRWGEPQAVLQGTIERNAREMTLQLQLTARGKRARVNGVDRKRMTEFIGNLNVVLFSPEDLQLIKGGPSERRRFLDLEIGQISPTYLHDISQYHKIMTQRNTVLRELAERSQLNFEMIEIWDEQLIEYGCRILEKRLQFMKKLQTFANEIHARISGGLELLTLRYTSSLFPNGTTVEAGMDFRSPFQKNLEKNRKLDWMRGSTSVGPHRDDISVDINGYNVGTYGSQGQQRTTALSMKLAEIELIRDEIGEYPILLLDDVLSELDSARQIELLRSMGERVQTFITSTSTFGLEAFMNADTQVFEVDSGHIKERS